MDFREKAKQLVVEEYLSSMNGGRALQEMEDTLRECHQYVPVAVELVKLLPEHEEFNVRLNSVVTGLRLICDLKVEQCNAIKELVRMECEGTNEPSLWPMWPDDDLPF